VQFSGFVSLGTDRGFSGPLREASASARTIYYSILHCTEYEYARAARFYFLFLPDAAATCKVPAPFSLWADRPPRTTTCVAEPCVVFLATALAFPFHHVSAQQDLDGAKNPLLCTLSARPPV
jgi:hypothetical protein